MGVVALTKHPPGLVRDISTWFDRDRGALIATALLVRVIADIALRPDFAGTPRLAFLLFIAASAYVLLRPWGRTVLDD
jgi:hypothetical protein